MTYLGELAALATSVLFSATSTQFTLAGREVGSVVVNRTRLVFAVILVVTAHLIAGVALPYPISPERAFWLSLSGIIGLVLGDAFLFQAFVLIGARLSMLMMSMVPIFSTILAWIFLGEKLSMGELLAISLTLTGIAWVVLEQNGKKARNPADTRTYFIGILLGLCAAAGQAEGLVTPKIGLAGDFPALSGTLIRMLAAMTVLWTYTIIRRQAKQTVTTLADHPRGVYLILGGSITGPFLGVTASLVAIQLTEVGIASTLMALPPVFLLPIGYFLFKERFGWQVVAGTFVAVAGVALLFLA